MIASERTAPRFVVKVNATPSTYAFFDAEAVPLKNLYSVAAGFKTYAFLNNWNKDTNLPMIRQVVKHQVLDQYINFMDSKYCDNSVLRTATGGLPHLKYDVNIFAKANSVAFQKESKEVDSYLSKVDRFQAKLGIMRLLKMGLPLSIIDPSFIINTDAHSLVTSLMLCDANKTDIFLSFL